MHDTYVIPGDVYIPDPDDIAVIRAALDRIAGALYALGLVGHAVSGGELNGHILGLERLDIEPGGILVGGSRVWNPSADVTTLPITVAPRVVGPHLTLV